GTRGGWNSSAGNVATFAGSPGGQVNVTASTLTADSLDFQATGYTAGTNNAANLLRLTTGQVSVAAGATATITAKTEFLAGLTKTGAGTLVLAPPSVNTVTGGNVSVAGGTLSIADDLALGATSVDVGLSNGGRLAYTGTGAYTVPSGRQLTVGATGGAIEAAGNDVRLATAGQLTGAGVLTKYGGRALVVQADNATFAGSVTVAEGALTLRSAGALGGRPITLAGGSVELASYDPMDVGSDVTVAPGATGAAIAVNLIVDEGEAGGQRVGALDVPAATPLALTGAGRRWLSVGSARVDGTVRVTGVGLEVRGALTGSGQVRIDGLNQLVESLRTGLIFTGGAGGGPARTTAVNLSAQDPVAGPIAVAAAGAGTAVTLTGAWSGGGAQQENYAVVRDGGQLTLGAGAAVDLVTADVAGLRTLRVWGDGGSSGLTIAPGFVADRTQGGTVAAGLGAVEVKDTTLTTHATAGLPVVTKQTGAGGMHRAGTLTLTGTGSAKWVIASAAQAYDGGVRVDAPATIQADQDLSHTGTVHAKWDGQFQIPAAVTLTKTGASRLTLAGEQGYAPGAGLVVSAGAVRFSTDPGAGWYAGNYTRDASGAVTVAPAPAGTLAVGVQTGAAAEFAAPVARVASLAVGSGGTARVESDGAWGARAIVTSSLSVAADGVMDLRADRLVVDYAVAGPSSASAVKALIVRGRTGGPPGTLWQGDGITSTLAASAGQTPGAPQLAVGIAEAADVLGLSGAQTATFGGVTVDASAVLVRVTLAGDADLDGAVGLNDLVRLANHYGGAGGWADGDFDYDGSVGLNDLVSLANGYGAALAGIAPPPAGDVAADWAAARAAAVPEPVALGWVGLVLALGRRRGR
ncbi:MAG TPA: autotransporter-associated beta strand repeat-containing protein, partial [Tepidisphaeraceae bacterium]|nr:autotransporter-associated beta strand repeat-containing protein [Tepidisphaeraceae bacterium]